MFILIVLVSCKIGLDTELFHIRLVLLTMNNFENANEIYYCLGVFYFVLVNFHQCFYSK